MASGSLETCKRSLSHDVFPSSMGPEDSVGIITFNGTIVSEISLSTANGDLLPNSGACRVTTFSRGPFH